MADRKKIARYVVASLLLGGGVAWASPWDIDMIDAVMFKAYEWNMKPQPKDSVARFADSAPRPRAAGYYQNAAVPEYSRLDVATTDSLTDPYAKDTNHVETGKKLFAVNCAPCHGQEGAGGGPVTYNDAEKGIRRFPMVAPNLSGDASRVKTLSDGFLYLTIRNGGAGSAGASKDRSSVEAAIGAGMPAYGPLLTDAERWAVVAYIRTLPNAAQPMPSPVEPAAVVPDGAAAPADAATPAPTPKPAGNP